MTVRVNELLRSMNDPARGPRNVVLAAAAAATGMRILLAARTWGTNDVTYWTRFAEGVREWGPIGVYGQLYDPAYNHPPLAGWMLAAINLLIAHDIGWFQLLLRLPACLADLVTALVLYELMSRRHDPRHSALAAVAVAWSPVLLTISGYHGNTDPVFVMLTLLSVFCASERGWMALAGATYAASLSLKLVPIVLGPLLVVFLVRQGRSRLAGFAAGFGAIFLPLWGPVLATRWSEFRHQVLGYAGISTREWGIIQFLEWSGAADSWTAMVAGPGRYVVLAASALGPAVLLLVRRVDLPQGAALAMTLTLLLSPAFGMQYLAWALAFSYLVSPSAGHAFNVNASAMVLVVYSHWSQAPPWRWYVASSRAFSPLEFVLMVLTWMALANVVLSGTRTALESRDGPPARPPHHDTSAARPHRISGSRDDASPDLG